MQFKIVDLTGAGDMLLKRETDSSVFFPLNLNEISRKALFLTSNTFSLVTPTSGVYQSEQSPRCHRQLVAADYVNGSSLYVVLTTVDFVSTFI